MLKQLLINHNALILKVLYEIIETF